MMGRLTESDDRGNWGLKGLPWKDLYPGHNITRNTYEKLYWALCKLKDYEDTGLSPDDVIRVNDFEQSQLGKLLKLYNEEQRKHRWIPVSERLPEVPKKNPEFENKPLELYLVSVRNGKYPFRAFWNGKFFTDGWSQVDAEAWMPLPEPYKE